MQIAVARAWRALSRGANPGKLQQYRVTRQQAINYVSSPNEETTLSGARHTRGIPEAANGRSPSRPSRNGESNGGARERSPLAPRP